MSSERLKILIVEDETLVGMGLQDQLTRLGHDVVAQAASAAEALEQFRLRQPDLVLVDVRLNAGDGVELAVECQKIRRVPMIVISAYSDASVSAKYTTSSLVPDQPKSATPTIGINARTMTFAA